MGNGLLCSRETLFSAGNFLFLGGQRPATCRPPLNVGMRKCTNRKNTRTVQDCKNKTEEWKMKENFQRQCLDEYRKTTGILEARFRVNSVFHSIQPLQEF
jgi:hypothetical protein